MTNKSSKIIFLFFSAIIGVLLISYIQNLDQSSWETVDGFELKIHGDLAQIEKFYTSLEDRLLGYPEWINIILTGELSNFQKDYTPFRSSVDHFENYHKIYTSVNMSTLLTKYSIYLEDVLLNAQGIDPNLIELELNRLFQFCLLLNTNFTAFDNVFIGDIIDVIKFDMNPYYDPINKIQTVNVVLHANKNIHPQLEQIKSQINVEVGELKTLIDVDVSILSHAFQIKNIDTLGLLENYKKYESSQYSHIYKYLPSINSTEFNTRMALMKQSIHNSKSNTTSTAKEFLVILSKIEEQLIEFQFRGKFHNLRILDFVNRLVGDGLNEFGALTSMINLLDDRRYRYRVNDYLTKSSKLLKSETQNIQELTYPHIQSLPNKIASIYWEDNRTLILKVK